MQRFTRMTLLTVVLLMNIAACTTLLDIVNRSSSTQIHGIVQAQDSGEPIAGVFVQLWHYPTLNQRPLQTASTDDNGRFAFDPLLVNEADVIILTVQGMPDWLPDQQQRDGQAVLLDAEFLFELAPMLFVGDMGWAALGGQVVDAQTGLPIPGAAVRLLGHSYMRTIPDQTMLTDQEGRFVFYPVFLHDTDGIRVMVESAGYLPAEMRRSGLEAYYEKIFEIELTTENDSAP